MGKVLQFPPRDQADLKSEFHTKQYESEGLEADHGVKEYEIENENVHFQNIGDGLATEPIPVGSSKRLSNLHKFKQEREAIKEENSIPGRLPSYKTTRVYTLSSIISDFDLEDTAVIRMIKKKPAGVLPKLAVVQSNQMQNMKEEGHNQVTRLGRTIFITDFGFESWISSQKGNPVEDELLQLLADFFSPTNTLYH